MKKNIDLLVLSDRYPPYSVGGAELSLHSVLKEIAKYINLFVISVYARDGAKASYEYEGVNVYSIKPYLEFPLHEVDPNIGTNIDKRSVAQKYMNDYFLFDASSKMNIDNLIKEGIDKEVFENSYTTAQIKNICENFNIKTLHADNLRSIGFAQSIDASRKIYTIRDNRFHEFNYKYENTDEEINLIYDNFNYRLSLLDTADEITVTSNFLLQSLERVRPDLNFTKIVNPIDDYKIVDDWVRDTKELSGFNIVIIGMLTENKGQVQLIKNLKSQIKTNKDIQIHLVGKGDRIKKRIIEISEEAGIRKQIILHNYLSREKVYRLIKSSQVVVLPTIWEEPFGRVPLEAGLMSKPVVSFAVGGLKETIINNRSGFLVNKEDYKALYEKILILQNDHELRKKMGDYARQHVMNEFNSDKITKEYCKVWNLSINKEQY